jgi:hypothetical protein
MKYILVYWIDAPLTENRFYESFGENERGKIERRISEIKQLKNYVGYHLYETVLLEWNIA